MKELSLKDILNIMKHFTDKKSVKPEFEYIFYNAEKNELVAVDTYRLFVIELKQELDFKENLFIDVNKINNNSSLFFTKNLMAFKENEIGKMFNYKKIFLRRCEKTTIDMRNKLDLPTIIMNVGSLVQKRFIIQYTDKYKSLLKLEINDIVISHTEPTRPFMIEGKIENFGGSNFKLVIMPLIITLYNNNFIKD